LIQNGAGEVLWRPLANPTALQISAFSDQTPKGFGLMQRARELADFADLEAHYQNRPGLWIEPMGDWGKGSVVLVEIPSDKEIYDNIVAYWRPETPLAPGDELRFAYQMTWGQEPTPESQVVRVHNTRIGKGFSDGLVVAIDFEQSPLIAAEPEAYTWIVRTSAGDVTPGILQRNPETGGLRLAFTFHPGEATLADFRSVLQHEGRTISETWLYRWTA
jgi:glucans biosynthesis protein